MIVRTVSKVIALIAVITVLFSNVATAQNYQSPCPNIFEYAYTGNGYIGIITLRDVSYGTTTVQIELTQPGVLNSDYSGKLSLNVDKDQVFDYIRSGSPITYRVDFPLQNVVPQVAEITVNNKRICSGPRYSPPRATINLEHTLRTYESLSAGPQPQPQTIRQPVIQTVRQPARQTTQTVRFINGRPVQQTIYSSAPDFESIGDNLNFDLSEFLKPSFDGQSTFITSNGVNTRNPFHSGMVPTQVQQPQTQQSRFQQQVPSTVPPTAPPVYVRPTPMPIFTASSQQSSESYINSVCGQENGNTDVSQLAVKGVEIAKSRFPWIVAIYTRNVSSLTFQCGGSLISTRTVVSAAHCFHQGMETIKPENLLLSMGRHSLSEWRDAINVEVERLIPHPDYRPELINFDADVAIVQLKQVVSFTLSVRPICLWQGSSDIRSVEGIGGVIVGWGVDETNTGISSVPKLVNATIVSELTCIRSNEKFYYLTSNRTLCAGNRDGSGPCMGDSGSGLMVRSRNKWMLRGTVSAALSSTAQQCNLDEYVVYSDIAKFVDWIKSNMLL